MRTEPPAQRARLEGPRIADAVEVEGIQPGGGFCVGVERRWDRLRRWSLRRFRPGYVRRMAGKRRGECRDCPHDIIDPRDLKLFRNVCGFWFRDEDDPFRWRGRLPLARAGLAEVTIASLAGAAALGAVAVPAAMTGHSALWILAAVVGFVWFQAVYFFRDPERIIPTDPEALLSPSDGVMTHIHEVDDPEFPGTRALRLSIYLSPFDVHLNRVPRDATVVAVRYFPGCFLKARHEECAVRNEQLWVDLEEPGGRLVRVKQISGAMARRLVCWLKLSEEVRAGERYGMIKYGSRADVLVPASSDIEITVKIGDRVAAGQTVLLRFTGETE